MRDAKLRVLVGAKTIDLPFIGENERMRGAASDFSHHDWEVEFFRDIYECFVIEAALGA